MSLSELNIGQEGRIVRIDANRATKDRLDGLGIIPGTYIKTCHTGWGIKIYEVKGSQIALRNRDAQNIFIA